MFNILDHLYGALTVRIHRYINKKKKSADISLIKSNLFVGGTNDIEIIAKNNIQAILDLRKESHHDKDKLKKFSMQHFKLSIPDRNTPTLEETQNAIKWIDSQIVQNKKVLVHCNLGRGRGPLMVILYLISKGMNPESAIDFVKKKRPFIFLNKKQISFIKQFQF